MTLDVVGAGFGRTGTLSLKLALERLGFDKCYHMGEVAQHPDHVALWEDASRGNPNWEQIFEGYKAGVDWPTSKFWRELAEYYPNSKVILSTRDPEGWYDSVRNTIYPRSTRLVNSENEGERRRSRWVVDNIWNGVFAGHVEDKAHAIAVYEANLEAVKQAIPASRLLVYEAPHDWGSLCEFLDRAVPDEPYPQVNTTTQFQSRGLLGSYDPEAPAS